MGNPSQWWFDLFGTRLSRRDMMRISRDVSACIALGALPISAADDRPLPEDVFAFGVASGDPAPDGVVLWTRLAPGDGAPGRLAVRWEVADDEAFRRIVKSGTSPAPVELGYSVHAEVSGLRAGRTYWYRFTSGGRVSATGRTRTAPAAHARPERIRFAFVSCQNYEHGYYTAHEHLAAEDLDFVVHLGDYIYEKRFPSSPTVREHEAGECITLPQYRARYAHYKRDTALQKSHAACPWIATTDDHEVANNFAGAVPQNPDPGDFLLRRAAAYQAFYEFLPFRRACLPTGPDMRMFRRLPFGDLIDLHVLDTRQYRTDQPCGDGTKPRCADALADTQTMMGAEQEQWLARGLRASRARWNVLANQVMINQVKRAPADGAADAELYSMDSWDGYVAARNRLMRVFADLKATNPVVITGDVHSNWVADLKLDFNDASSPIVGAEFVGTSISSGGDGAEGSVDAIAKLNPHIKFFNRRRGYVRNVVTPSRWVADYRVVEYVSRPGAPIETRASFAVEAGTRGIVRA